MGYILSRATCNQTTGRLSHTNQRKKGGNCSAWLGKWCDWVVLVDGYVVACREPGRPLEWKSWLLIGSEIRRLICCDGDLDSTYQCHCANVCVC